MQVDDAKDNALLPKKRFEREMGTISFLELQKHFAKGILIKVADQLDLVEVAVQMHADNTNQVQQWMESKVLERAHDDHAHFWLKNQSMLKAVTVAPWVLVQDIKKEN